MWMLKREELSEIMPLLTSKYYLRWANYCEKILTKSRDKKTINNPLELIAIQIGISRELEKAQQAIREGREGKQRALTAGKIEESNNFQKGIALNLGVARLAKSIMDGIAWRVLGFDRPFLRLMSGPKKYPGSVDLSESYLPTHNIA